MSVCGEEARSRADEELGKILIRTHDSPVNSLHVLPKVVGSGPPFLLRCTLVDVTAILLTALDEPTMNACFVSFQVILGPESILACTSRDITLECFAVSLVMFAGKDVRESAFGCGLQVAPIEYPAKDG